MQTIYWIGAIVLGLGIIGYAIICAAEAVREPSKYRSENLPEDFE